VAVKEEKNNNIGRKKDSVEYLMVIDFVAIKIKG